MMRGPADWTIEDARRDGRLHHDPETGDVYAEQPDGTREVVGWIPPKPAGPASLNPEEEP